MRIEHSSKMVLIDHYGEKGINQVSIIPSKLLFPYCDENISEISYMEKYENSKSY